MARSHTSNGTWATPMSFSDRWGVYEVVVYMAWGDERLVASEVSAARAVAEELDLSGDLLGPGSTLRRGPPMLGDLGLDRLRADAKLVAYASAAWVAFSDGQEHPAETAVLRTLRHRLEIDEGTARVLETSALLVGAQGPTASPRTQYRALLQAVLDVAGDHPWARLEPDAHETRPPRSPHRREVGGA